MAEDVLETVKDGVAVLTLNRPDRLNAMSGPMLDTLLEALPRLAEDPAVGVVVLTGAGRGFCAGGDVKAMAEGREFGGTTLEEKAQALRSRMEVSRWLHEMPKVTIAMRGWTILIVTLLVGAGLGAAGTVYLPSMVDPYLPKELRIRARVVEGQVLNKQREPNRLLVKIQLEQGVILATYTKRVAEVDLLVEPGDTIALELRSGEPVVDEPPIERVKRKK